MYGYIRPNRGELRMREYELYQAVYCGLCHELRRRYGPAARFLVNYDLSFLAMVLAEKQPALCRKRCIRHPLRKRRCAASFAGLETAADCAVILAWWKLTDEVRDGGFFKRLGARLAMLFLRRAYKKARCFRPDFHDAVVRELERLAELERQGCESLDACADTFAAILAAAGDEADGDRRRILRELLYHVGRSIYILDAADDLEEDVRCGSFNPLSLRFGPVLTQEDKGVLQQTLNLSQRQSVCALELLEETCFTPITENILTLGLPQLTELVLSGQWKQRRKLLREYTHDMER